MLGPLVLLSLGSIFFGYIFKDLFIGIGSDFFSSSIYIHPKNINLIDSEFIPFYIKLIPILFSFLGIFLSIFMFFFINKYKKLFLYNYLIKNLLIRKIYLNIYKFLNKK